MKKVINLKPNFNKTNLNIKIRKISDPWTSIGTILGLLLAMNIESVISGIESIIGFQFFPKDVFYINRFPSKILASDVISIIIGSLILVIIAAIYPAKRAGKINISEVLRHE